VSFHAACGAGSDPGSGARIASFVEGGNMRLLRSMAVLVIGGLVGSATAQVLPPPLSATVVNFDDVEAPSSVDQVVGPLTTEYSDLGITFGGFGRNGGARTQFFGSVPTGAASLPNVIYFLGIGTTQTGGLMTTPEFITFDPPVSTLQFDLTTLGFDCEGTLAVTADAFATGGALVESRTTVVPLDGITVAMSFPDPGVDRVILTSTKTCGSQLFIGVELFTLDNVAFTPVGSGNRSVCARKALDAATKKAKARAKCFSQAVSKGTPVDDACLAKASATFGKEFAKALKGDDCLTDADAEAVEGTVDGFVGNMVQLVTNGSGGPDICDSKKIAAAGKKAGDVGKCFSSSARNGTTVDDACVQKAASAFVKSLKKCSTPDGTLPLENLIDDFVRAVSRDVTVVTTTTSTTTSTTTTTTTAPPLGLHYKFTSAAGTANCGTAFSPADPPFSGAVYSDAEGTTKISDLGLACLYIGGGAGAVSPSQLPENVDTIFDTPDASQLVASAGTGPRDCTKGPAETKHCLNDTAVACTTDDDCFLDGACQPDANCYFGPPVPVFGFPASCVVNAFSADASGTIDLVGSTATLNVQLASRVFLSTLLPTPCPQCVDDACTGGQNAGGACTTNNVNLTSLDCPPGEGTYVATLPIDLNPLTTEDTTTSAADGLFCPGQTSPGAFGVADAKAFSQDGSIDIATGQATLVSSFCIPSTGSPSLDNLAKLPGPGTLSLPGVTVLLSSPSGAFLE
jgi:hypothetical protein